MKILLHICCANCAIYPAQTLKGEGHNLIGFWLNPNIHPYQEYKLRLDSLRGLADRWHIEMIYADEYKPLDFFKMFNTEEANSGSNGTDNDKLNNSCTEEPFLKSLIQFPQNPVVPNERCKSCYRLRLEKTAEQASKEGFDAFTTTLLISPYQNFEEITTIGNELADKYNILFYLRDFRPYFRKSMGEAKELGIYRQKYCGCIFSKEERRQKTR